MIMKTVRRELLGRAAAGGEGRGAGRAEVSVSGSIVVAISNLSFHCIDRPAVGPSDRPTVSAGFARYRPSELTQSAPTPPRNAHRCPRHARGAVKPEH